MPACVFAQETDAPSQGANASNASELSPETMYRLLVADIALQRGQPTIAARAYFEAAKEARNPVFARRATEIALATRQQSIALQAARLWSELDPDSERAKRLAATIAGEGVEGAAADARESGSTLKSQLEQILAEAAQKGQALGEAFLQLNRLLAQGNDPASSLRLVQQLAAPYDKVPEAHFAIAVAAFNTGMVDLSTAALAMREVDRALALNPGWERAAVLKAEILSKQSHAQAIEWLEGFVKAHPEAKRVSAALAQFYVQDKRYADARALFDRMIEQDPNSRELKLSRAALSVQMKDWAAAEAQFEALKDGDEDGTIALSLAEIAEESGRLPLALERYKAVPEGERGWLAKLRIGGVLGKMKRIDEAQRYLADLPAVTIEQRVQVRQTQAQVYREAGDYARALQVLEQGLSEHPDNPDLLYDAAMVAEKADRLELAEKHLKRVIELKPESAQALNALGYTLVDRTDRYAEGMEYIQRALKLSPDDAFILDSMGWAHYRMGQLDDAERFLRRAIAGRPDAEIAAHLGEVLWAKGERDLAREIWQSQLKSAPDNPVLLETVRRLAH
ncbi:MAG TPA: tetratricopeptide repeat protein [Casimicrobiaceae bacterium]|nr:tetratricopeptide repeat protein [Casimicrobiaceae bacterium]